MMRRYPSDNFVLFNIILMRSDWLECLAKYFASIRFKIKTNQCTHAQLSCLLRFAVKKINVIS